MEIYSLYLILGGVYSRYSIPEKDCNKITATGIYHGNSVEGGAIHNPFNYSVIYHIQAGFGVGGDPAL